MHTKNENKNENKEMNKMNKQTNKIKFKVLGFWDKNDDIDAELPYEAYEVASRTDIQEAVQEHLEDELFKLSKKKLDDICNGLAVVVRGDRLKIEEVR